MKVFVSSVIGGFESLRRAAAEAAQALDFEVIRAEEFSASSSSPQVACLSGVRAADAVLVILGARYGEVQASGKSATHEEFDEATRTKQVFVFVPQGIEPEPRQREFIAEAKAWGTGHFTNNFTDADDLRKKVTTAIHRWQLASVAGQVDAEEMQTRALGVLPPESRHHSSHGASLAVSIVGAPRQSILRPSEIEAPSLARRLGQQALYGEPSIFDTHQGIDDRIEGHTLTLKQERGYLSLGEDGSFLLVLPLARPERGGLDVMIEEEVTEKLVDALRFLSQVLDSIDSTERLSSVAIAAGILDPAQGEWRTRAEHERSPNSMQMSRMWDDSPVRAVLSPANRSRAALRQQFEVMAQDLTVLLRRFFRNESGR